MNSERPGEGEALVEGERDALGDDDGDTLAEGERLGETDDEGLCDALGLSDGEVELLGETLGEGDTEGLSLLLGETDADGESDGLTLGEPIDDTLRISTMPPTLGDALLSVNEPELTVVIASNTWSAQTTPCESLRSVHGEGVV